MIWSDLPPSIHIEDRRGEAPAPMTINQIIALINAGRRLPTQLSAPTSRPCELAKALGVKDI